LDQVSKTVTVPAEWWTNLNKAKSPLDVMPSKQQEHGEKCIADILSCKGDTEACDVFAFLLANNQITNNLKMLTS